MLCQNLVAHCDLWVFSVLTTEDVGLDLEAKVSNTCIILSLHVLLIYHHLLYESLPHICSMHLNHNFHLFYHTHNYLWQLSYGINSSYIFASNCDPTSLVAGYS